MVQHRDSRGDERATRRLRRQMLAMVAAWSAALSGCHTATPLQSDANTPMMQPVAADTAAPTPDAAASDARPWSRLFRECNTAARDEEARRRCLGEELIYQQRTLDRLLEERAAALDDAGRKDLQAAQRAWQQDTDRQCVTGTGATLQGDEAARCRIDHIIVRFDHLSLDGPGVPPGAWAKATPDAEGALEVRVGHAVLSMQSDGCAEQRGRMICRNARLRIGTPTLREQSLTVPMLVLTPPGQPGGTLYRGRLNNGFASGWHSVTLTDINADGHEDLLVWTGFDGNYGDPSYRYYLYRPDNGRLEENAALAELAEGHSIARITDGQVFVWSRSGPCKRDEKTIDMRGSVPVVAVSRSYDTCQQDKP